MRRTDRDRPSEIRDDKGPHDGKAQACVSIEREPVGNADTVVADPDDEVAVIVGNLDLHTRARSRAGEVDRVLDQLDERHCERHCYLAWQLSHPAADLDPQGSIR